MPVACEVDLENNIVLTRAWETLTDADLLDYQGKLTEDPQFTPGMDQFFDFREVEKVELTAKGIRLLADRSPFGEKSKRAFIIEPDEKHMFGMMRMFQILTEDHPDELRVQFDHVEAARSWLGIGEE